MHNALGSQIAVGDYVRIANDRKAHTGSFDPNCTGASQGIPTGRAMIVEVLPRRNQIGRRSAGKGVREQVIAANVDQVVAVMSLAQPAPKWRLLDRYLVSAEAADIPAVIVLTKQDLSGDINADQRDLETILEDYRQIGYNVHVCSSHTGEGLADLQLALEGRLSVLVGKSGVGKTSLLNALVPGLEQRVRQVSASTGKGRHTTSHQEMFPLAVGGALVDTPGMREFGLWGMETTADIAWCFPEMRPYLGICKFGLDCAHEDEPGCSVRQAVMAGAISPYRWQSYLRLLEEV